MILNPAVFKVESEDHKGVLNHFPGYGKNSLELYLFIFLIKYL